jgi:hypothetical protein
VNVAVLFPVAMITLLCIDGWLRKILAAYDRRTAALTEKPSQGEGTP